MAKQENKKTTSSEKASEQNVTRMGDLELSLIEVDTNFNNRSKYEGIEELSASIASEGQLNPLLVCETGNPKKPYRLIAGFRRFKALTMLKAKTGLVHVVTPKAVDDAIVMNLLENARRDTSGYDRARAYRTLVDKYHYTAERLIERLKSQADDEDSARGLSPQNVRKMVALFEPGKLANAVMDAWRENDLPLYFLYNIAPQPHDAQLKALQERLGVKPDGAEGGEDGDGTTPVDDKAKLPSKKALMSMLVLAEEAMRKGADRDRSEAIIDTIRCVLSGDELTVGGVTLWEQPKSKAQKASEKAQKLADKAAAKQAKVDAAALAGKAAGQAATQAAN